MNKSAFILSFLMFLSPVFGMPDGKVNKSANEIHVLSDPTVLTDLGIEQKDLSRYINSVETIFKDEFKGERIIKKDKGVLIELSIYSIREENPMVCEKNYKNCVMMEIKNTVVGGVDKEMLESFGKKLMNLDEVKVNNNRSKSKLNIVLYLNLSETHSGLNFKVIKPEIKPGKKSDDDFLKNA